MRKFFSWQKGRQGSGYDKMLIAQWFNSLVPFDIYLIKYPEGSKIDTHTDPVKEWRHVRINIVLKQAKSGGIFSGEGRIWGGQRFNVFYSDLPHEVSKIEQGSRLLLSVGFLKKP